MKKAEKILCAALGGAAAGFAGLYGLYRYAFYSPQGQQNDDYFISSNIPAPYREKITAAIDKLGAEPFESVSIRSADGLTLRGRYYPAADGAPLVIGCHGYRSTPLHDFSLGADIYRSMGCAMLLIEERAQCGSEGHTITFGAEEKNDVVLWTKWAAERFGNIKILLGGISMGAATVLMASALDLPENVRGIVADCPYTSAKSIIRSVGHSMHLPADALYPLARAGAKVFGGADIEEADALEAVKKTRVPILLIHGERDGFVPCDMSRALAAANPEMIEFHTFPGASHGMSCVVDRARYESLVKAFAARTIFAENTEKPAPDEELLFCAPTEEDSAEYAAYRQAFLDAGSSMDGTGSMRQYADAKDWLADNARYADPATVPEGKVQSTQFICKRASDGRMLGTLQVRHTLNEYLLHFGGHIGYSVRPDERRKGYASWMLRKALAYCRTLGLERVLITCDADNEASRRTIIKCGGVYENTEPHDGEAVERYWIEL